MRRGLIAALVGLTLAGVAWAQTPPPEYAWTKSASGTTRVVAWTVKSNPAQGLPQLLVLARDESSGKKPGEWVRASALVTMEVNCANNTGRIVEQVRYSADFKETARRAFSSPWTEFSELNEGAAPARAWCAAPGAVRQDTKTATVDAAQAWLDAMIPPRKPDPVPPKTASFEYAGMTSDSVRVDRWLDAGTITLAKGIAEAWVFEVSKEGWKPSERESVRSSPARWFLYEFDCAASQYRGAWFADLDSKLEIKNSRLTDYNKFTALNDQNLHQIRMRVCKNRPILFSEKYAGDIKSLAAARYGAGAAVGSTAKPQALPVAAPVDLGPTIRLTARNRLYNYVGTFTRVGATSEYRGEFMQASGAGKYNVSLLVKGIINGQLVIQQDGAVKDELRLPVANGKPSGKGISYNARDDDNYSWTLVEPTAIGGQTPVPPTPTPAPVAFQLPAVVKIVEASTKPGQGVYEATWTRRGASNIYDGAWIYQVNGQKFSDVLEVRGIENGKFVVYRQGIKGTYSFPMTNGKPARGTASWVSEPAFYVELLLN